MLLRELLEPLLFGAAIGIPLGLLFGYNNWNSKLILPVSLILTLLLYYPMLKN